MQRRAEREHDVVRHVDDVRDRSHPRCEQARLQPDRARPRRRAAEDPADVARAGREVLDAHVTGSSPAGSGSRPGGGASSPLVSAATSRAIFGLGYVGCVSAVCWADDGHSVVGVDSSPTKVAAVTAGDPPIREPQLDDRLRRVVGAGALRATDDPVEAVMATDVSCICVGTPNGEDGEVDLSYVRRVAEQIGEALAAKRRFHTIVLRSTVLPGTTCETVVPLLERASGMRAGSEFAVAFNPEFLREGTAIADFYAPGRTIVGSDDDATVALLADLYRALDAPLVCVSIRAAEMIKFVDNAFHAPKVTFANEVANICRQAACDPHEVMDVFTRDSKLNLSPTYSSTGTAVRRLLSAEGPAGTGRALRSSRRHPGSTSFGRPGEQIRSRSAAASTSFAGPDGIGSGWSD